MDGSNVSESGYINSTILIEGHTFTAWFKNKWYVELKAIASDGNSNLGELELEDIIQEMVTDKYLVQNQDGISGAQSLNLLLKAPDGNEHDVDRNDYKEKSKAQILKWRSLEEPIFRLNLADMCQNIQMEPPITVEYKGKYYSLIRMSRHLIFAFTVMSSIAVKVLSLREDFRKVAHVDSEYITIEGTSFLNDLKRHLQYFKLLICKEEKVDVSTEVSECGIKVDKEENTWMRIIELPVIENETLTKRIVHRICGELIGNCPVLGQSRLKCLFIQKNLKEKGKKIDLDSSADPHTMKMLKELTDSIRKGDPATGRWNVNGISECIVWCDASKLAIGICIEMDGDIIEDYASFRQESDNREINLAELESVKKGIELALPYHVKKIVIKNDNKNVVNWINDLLAKKDIKHQSPQLQHILEYIQELINENNVDIKIEWVKSEKNKADKLTRIPKEWSKDKTNLAELQSDKKGIEGVPIYHKIEIIIETGHKMGRQVNDLLRNESLTCPSVLLQNLQEFINANNVDSNTERVESLKNKNIFLIRATERSCEDEYSDVVIKPVEPLNNVIQNETIDDGNHEHICGARELFPRQPNIEDANDEPS